MATRAQIVRLTQRIDTFAARKLKSWPGKVVLIKVDRDEGEGAARERHYRAHPEDRGADTEIFLVIVDPKRGDGTFGHKTDDAIESPNDGPDVVYAWKECGETDAQAFERFYQERPAAQRARKIILFSWSSST